MWNLAIGGCKPLVSPVTAKQRRIQSRRQSDRAKDDRVLMAIKRIGQASITDIYFDLGDMSPSTITNVCRRMAEREVVRRIDGLPTRWEATR
jgi:DNA-binding MarR family transcriptional regulator